MQKNFTLKRIVCLLAALCLAAGLVGCADMPASSSEESSLPTILVGSDVYPPFNYIGEDGAPTGIDVELAKEAFRRMGYRAEFTIIDWDLKTQLLETGDIDCVWGSFTINGREDDYRWAGPYMASRQVVAVMPGSDIETIADLEGRTLAVQSTTKPEELFLTDATLPWARATWTPSPPTKSRSCSTCRTTTLSTAFWTSLYKWWGWASPLAKTTRAGWKRS